PIDLTPDTYSQPEWLARLPQALEVIAADPNIHTVFFQFGAISHRATEMMDAVGTLRSRTDRTVCVAWSMASPAGAGRLAAVGVYAFPEIARGLRAIGHLARYRAALAAPPRLDAAVTPAFDWVAFVAPSPPAGTVVPEPDCHRLLAAAGLATAAGRLAG